MSDQPAVVQVSAAHPSAEPSAFVASWLAADLHLGRDVEIETGDGWVRLSFVALPPALAETLQVLLRQERFEGWHVQPSMSCP